MARIWDQFPLPVLCKANANFSFYAYYTYTQKWWKMVERNLWVAGCLHIYLFDVVDDFSQGRWVSTPAVVA